MVRIPPHGLHIDDPDYHMVLYSQRLPRDKYLYFTKELDIPRDTFNTVERSVH